MVDHVLILAGGSGTRLWPASRNASPKQFLDLGGGKSLFQQTLERAAGLNHRGMTIVVTHRNHTEQIIDQWQALPPSPQRRVVLPEPVAKNTAPALAYGAAMLRSLGSAASRLIVLPSDHTVRPHEAFAACVEDASLLAERGFLVVFGIPPRGPETGYGYVESGEAEPPGQRVIGFHEKPDRQTAEDYLVKGGFYWNSGMFVYRTDTFLRELDRHCPEIYSPFSRLDVRLETRGTVSVPADMETIEEIYDSLPSISVDYALMEKSDETALVAARFSWSDVGSWDEVAKLHPSSAPALFTAESEGNSVFSDIPVALAGVRDHIVVIRNGVALVCKKGSSQLLRQIVRELEDGEGKALL